MKSMLFRLDQPVEITEEQVYNLPEHYFTSTTSTFCDRAMGKGDRLVVVARRLKEFGHSKENILSRLWGFERDDMHVQNCLNRTPLRGANIHKASYEDTTKENNMTFDCELGNPPYNKIDKFPLYYSFLQRIVVGEPGAWSLIIPNGWLIGVRARVLREQVFRSTGVKTIIFKGPSAFNNQVAQNTIIISGERGYTGDVTFVRSDSSKSYTTSFTREECVIQLPMVHGEEGKAIWNIAQAYQSKFEMKRRTSSWSVAVSDGNGFGGYDETTLSPTVAASKAIMPIHIVASTKDGYNHHTLTTEEDCLKAKRWMQSKLFGLMFMWVRTTHRTVGSNLGQMPMVIVTGEYTDQKAYEQLGLTKELIEWVEQL